MSSSGAPLPRTTSDGSADNSNSNSDDNNNDNDNNHHNHNHNNNTIASRIPAARPEGSPFAARGIVSF